MYQVNVGMKLVVVEANMSWWSVRLGEAGLWTDRLLLISLLVWFLFYL